MNFTQDLFELSPEEIQTSKDIYNGKVIKCLIAPHHTYSGLESAIPFTSTTLLFPERDMTEQQITSLISIIVNSPKTEEFRIITKHQNIIGSMVNTQCRILTQSGEIVPCEEKTFAANIHDIRYGILENKEYMNSEEIKNSASEIINPIIEKINNTESFTQEEADLLLTKINLIGEDLIKNTLIRMLRDKTTRG